MGRIIFEVVVRRLLWLLIMLLLLLLFVRSALNTVGVDLVIAVNSSGLVERITTLSQVTVTADDGLAVGELVVLVEDEDDGDDEDDNDADQDYH